MRLNKAHLVITYFFTCLGLLGCFLWMKDYAYTPKNPEWAFWVVPLQQAIFFCILGLNIIVVVILIIPNDWFVAWADQKLKEIKDR